MSDNPVLGAMRYFKLPMNRRTFLQLAYLGHLPGKLDPESEASLPDEPRFKEYPETTHEEVAAQEAEKEKKKGAK